jgi:hypothetical protein
LGTFLRSLWPEDDLDNAAAGGLRLPRADGSTLDIALEFAGIIADERALSAILTFKGASGTKPCALCKPLVSKDFPRPAGSCLVTLDSTLPGCQPHTQETWQDMLRLLAAAAAHRTQGELRDLEQAVGLRWLPTGLWWAPDTRRLLNPAHVTVDAFHIFLSQGVAASEISCAGLT